jgi:hypothetical protein
MDLEFIVAPVVIWILVSGLYSLMELYARRNERMAIIEKLGDKFDPSLLNSMTAGFRGLNVSKSFSSLKIGCLLFGVGLGLLVGLLIATALISDGYDHDHNRDLFGTAYASSFLLFGGLGLLTSFIIETRMKNREKQG